MPPQPRNPRQRPHTDHWPSTGLKNKKTSCAIRPDGCILIKVTHTHDIVPPQPRNPRQRPHTDHWPSTGFPARSLEAPKNGRPAVITEFEQFDCKMGNFCAKIGSFSIVAKASSCYNYRWSGWFQAGDFLLLRRKNRISPAPAVKGSRRRSKKSIVAKASSCYNYRWSGWFQAGDFLLLRRKNRISPAPAVKGSRRRSKKSGRQPGGVPPRSTAKLLKGANKECRSPIPSRIC